MYNEYRTHLSQSNQKIHDILESCETPEQLEVTLNVIDSFTGICEFRTNKLYKLHKKHPFNKTLKREFEMYLVAANEIISDICGQAKTLMNEFKEIESDEIYVPGFSGMLKENE